MPQLIRPHQRDIGFSVQRLLPAAVQQRVGPFIFFDHMGPAHFEARTHSGDVRAHPHIGLATVTYLFSGAMMHRDSLGSVQRIEPGAINLMTAGRGISHSERIPDDIRDSQAVVEGIQTWLALPLEDEECAPAFVHHAADTLPLHEAPGVVARVLLGEAFGRVSPVQTASPTVYVDLQLEAGSSLTLPARPDQLALYLAQGTLDVNGEALPVNHVLLLDDQREITLNAGSDVRCLLFGGEPLPGERHINWNFVSSRRERIEAAREDWQNGEFPMVPGESERIPLPR